MATNPSATTTIDDTAGAFAGGTGYLVLLGCAAKSADNTPRVFTSTKALLAQHDYSPAADFAAMHFEETGQPVIFLGLPVATAGVAGKNAFTGTGTSAITITAGGEGIMEEVDASFTVVNGGTIGVNGITANLSMDGGRTSVLVRLGTAVTYTVPNLGIVFNFAAGTLVAGDLYTFVTTAPMWDTAGMTAAKTALEAQMKLARSWMVVGDIVNSTFQGYVTTAVNAYETESERFCFARTQVRDRRASAKLLGVATTTFANVSSADTATRNVGSWISDGFAVGDIVTFAGTVSNNQTTGGPIAALTATIMTFEALTSLVNEGPVAATCVRAAETPAAHVSAMDAAFATVDGQKRVDLALGRGRKQSPITPWAFRRPAAWAASLREYSHDVQVPTWRKSDGPLDGWDLTDGNGNTVEYDERTQGGALAARFTCLRSWANGPRGAFVALSLTRATEGSLLSRTHNMAVADLVCTVTQAETENAIGQVLILNPDGTGTDASLGIIEGRVNTALQIAVLQARSEGQRATSCVWSASRSDILNVPGATLTGTTKLILNGTLEKLTTSVRVTTG